MFKQSADVEKVNPDSLGSSILDTGLQQMLVDVAYITTAKSGAKGLVVHAKAADGSRASVRDTFWIQSGDTKGNKTYYVDSKTNAKRPLPGFTDGEQFTQICAGLDLHECTTEERIIKLWDSVSKEEVNTPVEAVIDVIGKPVVLGIQKVRSNKVKKNETTGKYDKINEERFSNIIDKCFTAMGNLTVTERDAGETEGTFVTRWTDRNPADYVKDDYKEQKNQPAAAASEAAVPAAATVKPLFGNS
jgi:hypothetical protein